MGLKIRKGDKVEIIAGKDKGKSGKVLKTFSSQGRVIVEGINIGKKHFRKRSESDTGGIKEIPLPLHISNVALFCSRCERGVRFMIQALQDKKDKIRVCKKCRQPI